MELIIPGKIEPEKFVINKLWDYDTNEEIEFVNPGKVGQTVILKIPYNVKPSFLKDRINEILNGKDTIHVVTDDDLVRK